MLSGYEGRQTFLAVNIAKIKKILYSTLRLTGISRKKKHTCVHGQELIAYPGGGDSFQ